MLTLFIEDLLTVSNRTSPAVSSGTSLRLDIIPKGMPNTVVPCSAEGSPANGLPNGHIMLHPASSFMGYIIAIHRKMVSAYCKNVIINI